MPRCLALLAFLALPACGGTRAPAPPSPDAAVLLRLAPPVGQVSRYQGIIETTMEMPDMPMMGSPTTVRQTVHSTQTVLAADGDTHHLTVIIDSVAIDAPGVFGMMSQSALMMEGLTQRIAMTTRGEIVSSEIEDSTLTTGLRQAMGTVQDVVSGLSLELPAEPVRRGATWTVPIERSVPLGNIGSMNQTMEFTYRFERLELRDGARHAMLAFSGPIRQTMLSDSTASMQFEMELEGDFTGQMDLNIDAGRVEAMQATMGFGGFMTAMGQDITMVMTVSMEQALLP